MNICILLLFKIMKSENDSHSVVSDSLRPHGLYSPWNSPGQITGVGNPGIEPRSSALQDNKYSLLITSA